MIASKKPAGRKTGPKKGGRGAGKKPKRAIEHVVIIVKEHHGVDNYFGTLRGATGATLPRSPNPPHQDPNHTHDAWLTRKTTAVREQFVEQDIPASLAYARKFASAQFRQDAAAGKLPNVSWVYAPHDASEHPPDPNDAGNPLVGNVTHGMQWTVDQVNAVVQGGLWPKTAIFVTWDDWGGWLDHVDPPNVEQWKHDPKHPDRDGNHPQWNGTQFRYGSRVGCLVLGPYAKSGYISRVLHSHVSLLKFC